MSWRCWPPSASCPCGRDVVGALPALAENVLSSGPVLFNYRAQYQGFLLPLLFLAAIAGYARLTARRAAPWRVSSPWRWRSCRASCSRRLWPTTWPWPDGGQARRAAYLRRLVTAFPSGIDRAEYVLVNEAAYP
jgi:hypothetical protein